MNPEVTAIQAPRRQLLPEIAGLFRELIRLPALNRQLAPLPRANGEPVLVIPGYLTSDWSTVVLRHALRKVGFTPQPWGLGRNHGNIGELIPALVERTAELERVHGPIPLVGWSHGGLLAREVARVRPDLVSQVITLGTPVVGGPKYTAIADRYAHLDLDAIEREIERQARENPLQVPVTAIYTRRDCVVAWRACIDRVDQATHIEVDTTHAGLVVSARSLEVVLRALAP